MSAEPPAKRAPQIGCVVPAYQSVALVGRCLLSIVAQQDIETEIIVVDDSTTPEVAQFVTQLAQFYPQIRHRPGARTGNPVENWNLGLDQLTANFAVVIHHDEHLIDPLYLRRAIDILRGGAAKVVVGGVQVTGGARKSRFPIAARLGRALRLPPWTLFLANWIGPTAAVVFRPAPDLRFDPRLVWKVDTDFYIRLIRRHADIHHDNRLCVGSVVHADQITAGIDTARLNLEELMFLSRAEPRRFRSWQESLMIGYATMRLALRPKLPDKTESSNPGNLDSRTNHP